MTRVRAVIFRWFWANQAKPRSVLHTSFPSGFPMEMDALKIFFNWKRNQSNSRCAYPTTTNIALLCKMIRIPFLFPTRKSLSGIDSPKKPLVLIWTKKSFFEDFHIKIFNWKRKRSNSKFQDRCAYQTTTNIALLCKMVRIPFLFPTRNLSGVTPQKSLWSWFGQKNHFSKTFT